jgi:3alpha(or 20beta)-hydroxysteroid dehydrogenase
MARLFGKVALITGGARGMGAAHAELFVKEGAKVIITDVLEEEGKQLAKKLGSNVVFYKHDVTKVEDWKSVVADGEKLFGPINILVNNAGIAGMPKTIVETTDEHYDKVYRINQLGVFLGMREVIPSMKRSKDPHRSIVNISSIAGMLGGENLVAYVASKFAVRGMTKVAAIELGKDGIRVNSIHPGVIETPMTNHPDFINSVREMAKALPLGRTAQAGEVSNLALFLSSDESSYCTGQEFVIDGGQLASY